MARREKLYWPPLRGIAAPSSANDDAPIRIGSLTEKELDLLGASCCTGDDFAEAVGVVERNGSAIRGLISHEFPLAETPEALRYAIGNPTDVMKVVIVNG